MKELPITFSDEMVRAILDGRKTQTRRVVFNGRESRPGYARGTWNSYGFKVVRGRSLESQMWTAGAIQKQIRCPYGQPGDPLWVREAHAFSKKNIIAYRSTAECGAWMYDGGGGRVWVHHGYVMEAPAYSELFQAPSETLSLTKFGGRWRPATQMPRWASRITLEVTGVRVERVQDISERDARAEGYPGDGVYIPHGCTGRPRCWFAHIWDSIHAKPKPVRRNGEISHYESYPWTWLSGTRTYRDKPWYVFGCPLVWVIELKKRESN